MEESLRTACSVLSVTPHFLLMDSLCSPLRVDPAHALALSGRPPSARTANPTRTPRRHPTRTLALALPTVSHIRLPPSPSTKASHSCIKPLPYNLSVTSTDRSDQTLASSGWKVAGRASAMHLRSHSNMKRCISLVILQPPPVYQDLDYRVRWAAESLLVSGTWRSYL